MRRDLRCNYQLDNGLCLIWWKSFGSARGLLAPVLDGTRNRHRPGSSESFSSRSASNQALEWIVERRHNLMEV